MIFMIDQFVFWWFITWSIVYNDRQHAQTSIKTVPDPFSFINLQLVLVLVLTWVSWVDAVLTVSILQGAPAASALIRGPERRTWEEDWDQDELWTEFRNQEPGTRTRTVYRWFTFLPACVGLRRITGMCWAPGCRPTSTLQQLDCTGCLKTPAHVYGPTVGLNSTGAGSKRLQNVSDGWA